jgi:hypothetical protein
MGRRGQLWAGGIQNVAKQLKAAIGTVCRPKEALHWARSRLTRKCKTGGRGRGGAPWLVRPAGLTSEVEIYTVENPA